MAKEPATLSVVDIEKLIQERQGQIEALVEKRDQLESEIERIDRDIQSLLARGTSTRGRRRVKKFVVTSDCDA